MSIMETQHKVYNPSSSGPEHGEESQWLSNPYLLEVQKAPPTPFPLQTPQTYANGDKWGTTISPWDSTRPIPMASTIQHFPAPQTLTQQGHAYSSLHWGAPEGRSYVANSPQKS